MEPTLGMRIVRSASMWVASLRARSRRTCLSCSVATRTKSARQMATPFVVCKKCGLSPGDPRGRPGCANGSVLVGPAVLVFQPPRHERADQFGHRGAFALGERLQRLSVLVIEPDNLIVPELF